MAEEKPLIIRLLEVNDQKVNVEEFNSWEKLKVYATRKTGTVTKSNRDS